MEEQTRTGTPAGAGSDMPPRWALERAGLQSDVDALVHQALAGLLKAAEDLKQRIRAETLAEIQEGRRERDSIREEIAAARHELDELRNGQTATAQEELERERESILAEARAEADRIVQAAQAERDSMLGEIRATEIRLRSFQEQIQSFLRFGGGAGAGAASSPGAASAWSLPASTVVEPHPASPMAGTAPPPAPVVPSPEPPRPAVEVPAVPEAPTLPSNYSGLIDTAAGPPAQHASAPTPPLSEPPPSAGPRTMQLIFTNVPGYQQAAAIERTTRQLPDVSNVDVQEFERGRLVLELQAGTPAALAQQMVSNAPATMSVADQSSSAIIFQLS